MNTLDGLRAAIGDVVTNPTPCPECGSTTRIERGICGSCLLREALADEGEKSRATFEDELVRAGVSDTEWQLGQYLILEEIGRGGMGVIYRARQRHSRRIVAVKRILRYEAESHETLVRFRREAEAVASLDHPNILPIYEVGETEDGIPFYSMKLAAGGSLRSAGPTLRDDPRECARLVAAVARAVDYAHSQGILHRDLQPGNILLDGRGKPFLSDFGLAKWLGRNSDLTLSLTTLGTPGFIAPEQAETGSATLAPAADIYSLGAILFDLFAGRPPFVGPNAISVIRQAAEVPAPKLRSLRPKLDRDLETIVDRCLERDPSARYASAAALAQDLEDWIAGRTIAARPISHGRRCWRWICREPALAGATAVCLFLAAGLFLSLRALPDASPSLPLGKSIAVLPFEDLSGKEANPLFNEGVLEDILTSLGRVADLKVISASSVRDFTPKKARNLRAIGRELGVRYILEGSLRKTDTRVRFNTRLSDSQSGQQLWAESYDRDLRDVFAVQAAIAAQIADQMEAHLSPQEQKSILARPTADLAVYELYLRARELARQAYWLSTDQRVETQVKLLDEVVARAPDFIPALCLLARTHAQSYFSNRDHTPARLEAAWHAVERAARQQPEAGEVHLARGIVLYWGERNYVAARGELILARRLLPNEADIPYFMGLIARREGDWLASTALFEEARAIDPRNEIILYDLARTNYFALKRYREAAEAADSVLAWKPAAFDFLLARAMIDVAGRADLRRWQSTVWGPETESVDDELLASERVELALHQRDYQGARRALGSHRLPQFRWDGYVVPREWYEGLIALGLGEKDAARSAFIAARAFVGRTLVERPDDAQARIVLAAILARLGEKEEALREGERAVALRPVQTDAIDGAFIAGRFAAVCALVGEKERALSLLEEVAPVPYAINYGSLMLEDCWDPLRGNPRFEKIVASLAPSPDR